VKLALPAAAAAAAGSTGGNAACNLSQVVHKYLVATWVYLQDCCSLRGHTHLLSFHGICLSIMDALLLNCGCVVAQLCPLLHVPGLPPSNAASR
jgi:hypothetical protein